MTWRGPAQGSVDDLQLDVYLGLDVDGHEVGSCGGQALPLGHYPPGDGRLDPLQYPPPNGCNVPDHLGHP